MGDTPVYLNGGLSDGGAVPFLDDGTIQSSGAPLWSNAQSAMRLEVEFTSLADLIKGNVYVTGYFFIPESDGPPATRNACANVHNGSGGSITINLVWHYDVYVTNYMTGSGKIG
jgi:hypothetical protein